MSRLFLVFSASIISVFIATSAFAKNELTIQNSGMEYKASVDRSTKLANDALPLISKIDTVDEQAKKMGKSVEDFLGKSKYKEYVADTVKLRKMLALQYFESSLIKDITILDKLYKASLLLHKHQIAYILRTGSTRGLNEYLNKLKLSDETILYFQILTKLESMVNLNNKPKPKVRQ